MLGVSACSQSEADVTAAGEPGTTASPEESTAAVVTFDATHRGEATFYRATGKGNCSFTASDDRLVAAINSRDYANAAMCGAYLAVSGPDGTVTVRITDRCPGCKPGGLDLSREAFARIAPKAAGRVPITWQIVAGPVSGPVSYHYMKGSSRYWMAIQLRNHRWPVAALEIMPAGTTTWLPLERRAYNYFVHPKPIAAGSLRVRVTALTGATLEDELPEPTGLKLIEGAAQFP
ncbi:MAG TPA: expansin EXLX1 family cellulose-binding protein [Gammaproteobacteria bacterium]